MGEAGELCYLACAAAPGRPARYTVFPHSCDLVLCKPHSSYTYDTPNVLNSVLYELSRIQCPFKLKLKNVLKSNLEGVVSGISGIFSPRV